MARNVIVELTDDLDGSKGERTVAFALDGKSYEIDLSKKNAAALEKALKPYLAAGRRIRVRGNGRIRSAAAPRGRGETPEIRAWAAANGYPVGDRGRIPAEVVAAYEAAK